MKRLLAAILVVALVRSGWWLWISQQRRAALTGWFADRAAAGWVAETAGLSVVGYPTRVDAFVAQPVIADPATSDAVGLPGARAEAAAIETLYRTMTEEVHEDLRFSCEVISGEIMTGEILRQMLRSGDYDVLHFAGHGLFDSARPEDSGWLLSDGILTVTELQNTLRWCKSPPWLIYANACSGGMVEARVPRYQGTVHGMADACIRAGVSAFIAPLWKIHDESAKLLATSFYRALLLDRTTIGVAMQQARLQVKKTWNMRRGDTGLGDISWAGVVLFGNPGVRIDDAFDYPEES